MAPKLEICIEHIDSAAAAQAGGADRIELCANLAQGGTTPSIGLIERVRERIEIEIMVMIRPRGGDFLYTPAEFDIMARNIRRIHGLGVDGVVFGLLNPDGSIDRERSARLIELARPLQVTFHRAFDMSRDPHESLNTLLELGVDRILTSGQAPSAMAGIELIQKLQATAEERLIIMPGGGIHAGNARSLLDQAGVRELHVGNGVKEKVRSDMAFQNDRLFMGNPEAGSEFEQARVSIEKVRALMAATMNPGLD